MSKIIRDTRWNMDAQRHLREELDAQIDTLSLPEIQVLLLFARQVMAYHDPDVVGDFLAWREDPRLGSILQLAAAVSDDLREQLLFVAEDFYASEKSQARE